MFSSCCLIRLWNSSDSVSALCMSLISGSSHYQNIFLYLRTVCMSFVPGSSLTRISFWTCLRCACFLFPDPPLTRISFWIWVICLCRLFSGHHLIKISFWTCVLCVWFFLFPDRSLTRISVWTCVLCVYRLFPGHHLLEYPFGLACYVYVFCFRVVPLLEYPFGHDASISDNISVWNWSFNTHRTIAQGWGYGHGINATFNYSSVISWRSVLLVEETGIHGETHRPISRHWQLYHIMLYRLFA